MITDQNQLLTGLKTFYTTTGVQPYVYFTAEETLDDTYAGEVYDSLFTDEGHFLLLIHSTPILLIVGTVLLLMIIGIIFIILRSRKTKVSGNETKTEPDIFTQMDTERDSED